MGWDMMRTLAIVGCLMLGVAASAHAQDADLTLPPDLRGDTAASASVARAVRPAKAKKATARTGTRAEPKTASPVAADGASVTAPKAADAPVSFGMKWNANNTPESATRATSGLSEINKNHDGEAAGVGAKLGLGYKF